MKIASYWNGTGKFEAKLAILHKLIDDKLNDNGEVRNKHQNAQLERLRKVKNAYYRLFNDGDTNRILQITAADVRHRSSSWIEMEANMVADDQILAAWEEQQALGTV